MRPTSIYSLSTELGANTIDPDKLNCRVRNGNGCCLIGNNISLIKAFLLKDQIWYKEAIYGNNFFVYPGWNPSRRFLSGSSTSFQPLLLYQITLEKRKCYTHVWIKEYGQAARPISTD